MPFFRFRILQYLLNFQFVTDIVQVRGEGRGFAQLGAQGEGLVPVGEDCFLAP